MPPPSNPGATLKALREKRGLTQQAFADKIGKSRTAVAAWEYGRAMSLKSRTVVAKFFGVEPDTLGPPWNPHGARPQHKRRAREEAAYMEDLRRLGRIPQLPGVDPDHDAGVTSDSPAQLYGDVMANIPDPEAFAKIVGFWRAMEPAARQAFTREAWKYASPDWSATPGARGKAQG